MADIPARFRDRTLDSYAPSTPSATKALEAARRMGNGEIGSLVLVGPTGVGKTHLAAGVVACVSKGIRRAYNAEFDQAESEGRRAPRYPKFPAWLNVADAIVRVRCEIGMDERPTTSEVMALHVHPTLVVLDDLGREKVSDWTAEIVYALVNARYEALLPTLVTTNLTGSELAASPYWPCVSRLAEGGELVRIEAPDRRLAR